MTGVLIRAGKSFLEICVDEQLSLHMQEPVNISALRYWGEYSHMINAQNPNAMYRYAQEFGKRIRVDYVLVTSVRQEAEYVHAVFTYFIKKHP